MGEGILFMCRERKKKYHTFIHAFIFLLRFQRLEMGYGQISGRRVMAVASQTVAYPRLRSSSLRLLRQCWIGRVSNQVMTRRKYEGYLRRFM